VPTLKNGRRIEETYMRSIINSEEETEAMHPKIWKIIR